MATLAMKVCVDEAKVLLESTALEREESLPSLHPSSENCSLKSQGSLAYRKTSGINGSCVAKHALRPLSTASLNTNTRTTQCENPISCPSSNAIRFSAESMAFLTTTSPLPLSRNTTRLPTFTLSFCRTSLVRVTRKFGWTLLLPSGFSMKESFQQSIPNLADNGMWEVYQEYVRVGASSLVVF